MSNKRNPGKNGSLQRDMEKAERWEWNALNRAWDSKKKRIRKKSRDMYWRAGNARRAFFAHCQELAGDNW